MKPLSKFTLYFAIAAVLALVLAVFSPAGQKALGGAKAWPGAGKLTNLVDQVAGLVRADRTPAGPSPEAAASATAPALVKMPAIRGESNYGWVQLPWGTPVDLLRRTPDSLIVRWDGTVVQLPPTAALSGAIALRAPLHVDF